MPEISRFYGIVVQMFYDEHLPPHFHVEYGGHKASFTIDPVALLAGSVPARVQAMVQEWADLHRKALKKNWARARKKQELKPIPGLN